MKRGYKEDGTPARSEQHEAPREDYAPQWEGHRCLVFRCMNEAEGTWRGGFYCQRHLNEAIEGRAHDIYAEPFSFEPENP